VNSQYNGSEQQRRRWLYRGKSLKGDQTGSNPLQIVDVLTFPLFYPTLGFWRGSGRVFRLIILTVLDALHLA
jgi:hypothetical protein